MLPKRNRVTTKEWEKVYKNGKRISSPLFTLVYMDTIGLSPCNKVGVAIPKKVAKLATKRNEIKRYVISSLEEWAKKEGSLSITVVVHSFADPDLFKRSLLEKIASIV